MRKKCIIGDLITFHLVCRLYLQDMIFQMLTKSKVFDFHPNLKPGHTGRLNSTQLNSRVELSWNQSQSVA